MDFRDAINAVIGDLTPQPWQYTAADGATLTVIPAGLREAPGYGEVYVRVTADKTRAAEVGVTTTYMASVLHAIDTSTGYEYINGLWDEIVITPTEGGGLYIEVSEVHYEPRREVRTAIVLPPEQRLPLASAMRRACDVAKSWEDPV
ncbi:hypothetical protein ACFV3E_24590 [Streptomyces sp. NPDC059718]